MKTTHFPKMTKDWAIETCAARLRTVEHLLQKEYPGDAELRSELVVLRRELTKLQG